MGHRLCSEDILFNCDLKFIMSCVDGKHKCVIVIFGNKFSEK